MANNPIRSFQVFRKHNLKMTALNQIECKNQNYMCNRFLLSRFSKYFSSTEKKGEGDKFDLVRTYNDLIEKGEIEVNVEQNRVINELENVGEKILKHVDLLHKYRNSEHFKTNKPPTSSEPIKPKSSGSIWNLFGGKKEEDPIIRTKIPNKVFKTLPEEFSELQNLRGVYLWGSPGTGKTYLMDMFYNELPVKKKRRLHYAEFMLQIHEEEHKINQQKERSVDTILKVGNEYSKDVEVICIDEFQVLHISDAMILKRLFEAFFENNIICFLTSNRPPCDLYLNGLQRFLFLPFIDMVNTKMNVISLDGVDYRTRDYSIVKDK